MKTINLHYLILLFAITLSSCYKREGWGVRGHGDTVTEKRQLKDADRIHLFTEADVEYRQDSIYFLEVSAQPNILAVLETEVSGSTLKIKSKRNLWNHKKVKITVHTPGMKGLHISGSGNINSYSPVTSSNLDLNISGSGSISLSNLSVTVLSGIISGSGNISLREGNCDLQIMNISGSGNIRSENCICRSNSSHISGSGNIEIHVTETLDANISGSGDIRYRGRPGVSTTISGSGRVTQIQ
jgi:hypothetical protein